MKVSGIEGYESICLVIKMSHSHLVWTLGNFPLQTNNKINTDVRNSKKIYLCGV